MFNLSDKEKQAIKTLKECGYNVDKITQENTDEYQEIEIILVKKDYKTVGGTFVVGVLNK